MRFLAFFRLCADGTRFVRLTGERKRSILSTGRTAMEIDDPEEFQGRRPRNVAVIKKIVFGAIFLELMALIWFLTRR